MSETAVRDEVRKFIRDAFLVDEVGDDTSFLATGVVDSLGIAQIVAFVESRYGVRVPSTDLLPENFDSVAAIASYVERRLRAAAG